MPNVPYVSDNGIQFDYILRRNGSVIDLTAYTIGQISLCYQKTSGTLVTVTPTTIVSPTAGQIRYLVSTTTFLSEAGQWQVQGMITPSTTERFHSDPITFEIGALL